MADTAEVKTDAVENTTTEKEVAVNPETTEPESSAEVAEATTNVETEDKGEKEAESTTLKRKTDETADVDEAKKLKTDETPVEKELVETKEGDQPVEKSEKLPEETTKTAEDVAQLAGEVTEGVAA